MALQNAAPKTGGANAVTGGTSLTFAPDGTTVPNGIHLIVPATADYRVRQSVTAVFRAPVLLGDGTYKRDSKRMTYNVPFILASGKIVNNVIRVEREVHPEFPAANALDLNTILAQLLYGTDAVNFWAAGSIA